MSKRMFVIPGGFVPYNDTVTLLTYKRLRNLNLCLDIFSFKGPEDKGILKELEKDLEYKKFNIKYTSDYDFAIARRYPSRLPISLILMWKYIRDSLKEFEKNEYDYLFTSSVPGISHLCGRKIKRNHPEVKWIASFSDPFKNSPYKKDPDVEKSNLINKIAFHVGAFIYYNNIYEEAAVKYADKLVFICEEQRDFTLNQYPDLNREELMKKSVIYPLTYIEEWDMYKDLINVKAQSNLVKQAVHLGRLYGLRKIDNFLQALKELNEEDNRLKEKIVFHQYSEIQPSDLMKIKEYHLEELFIVHDKVSYNESVNIMKNADALVLFDSLMPNEKIQPYLPSKIVEYLILKKPILGICDENSPSYRIMKEYGFNEVGSSVENIKNNIKAIINNDYHFNYSLDKLENKEYKDILLDDER